MNWEHSRKFDLALYKSYERIAPKPQKRHASCCNRYLHICIIRSGMLLVDFLLFANCQKHLGSFFNFCSGTLLFSCYVGTIWGTGIFKFKKIDFVQTKLITLKRKHRYCYYVDTTTLCHFQNTVDAVKPILLPKTKFRLHASFV